MTRIRQSEIISYLDMCQEEGANLQRGMNFRLRQRYSVILMSLRRGAPYNDRVEDNGRILIYEGHDIPNSQGVKEPKEIDQPEYTPNRRLTQNGLFNKAAQEYKKNLRKAELVKVYEKIKAGIWVYNGLFRLVDAWREFSNNRWVFKFKLELIDYGVSEVETQNGNVPQNRLIPTSVKLEVWKRDQGKCVICGKSDNLHFDHIIPFSKGGSSLTADNIQLLCTGHNLSKHNRIQ